MNNVCIIAEIGVNHNGDLGLAKKLVQAAAEANVNIVKFQIFKPEAVISNHAPKAEYQNVTTDPDESQLDMVRKLELSDNDFTEIVTYCQKFGLEFLASPFDLASIDFMLSLGLTAFKIPSGEITNLPYLRKIGKANKLIILSTGMSTLGEVETALDILETSGTERANITLLQCTTAYPTPYADVNLKAMVTLSHAFPGVKIGLSDHTVGLETSFAAVAIGATVIEKHFTLDKNLPGPDHKASLEPSELAALVQGIRNVESALGNGIKRPAASEYPNIVIARKSLVAARPIKAGELFTESNLSVKRPGNGISPMRWDEVCGRQAKRDFEADELIAL